jgi:hypothetical protein
MYTIDKDIVLPIVQDGPTWIAVIRGLVPAHANAPNTYWTIYLPAITSLRFFGIASADIN